MAINSDYKTDKMSLCREILVTSAWHLKALACFLFVKQRDELNGEEVFKM